MKKIYKLQQGSPVYSGLSTLSLKLETPNVIPTLPQISSFQFPVPLSNSYSTFQTNQIINKTTNDWNNFKEQLKEQLQNPTINNQSNILNKKQGFFENFKNAGKQISGIVANQLVDIAADKFNPFSEEDGELGRAMGTLFSQGISSAGNTLANNLVKNVGLTQGLSKNTLNSLTGTGVGIASNLIGQGINSLGGNSRLSRAIGQGVSTGMGTIGGHAITNLVNTGSIGKVFGGSGLFKSTQGVINPYALGAQVLGSVIGAATGPSKEYGGKYGGITKTMDTAYDLVSMGVNSLPGIGQGVSGIMALNKGLSNIFGSTDGMTKTDAILGSAFMPAPVKWLNMWGSSKTGTFNNQSWQNSQKATSFMQDAFGNLQSRFDKAREEAGKTYGTFSQGAKRRAQENIDFANRSWGTILDMADQNIYQNIRSQAMSSINNQRYAQNIQGGWSPIYRGKQGMKIFNNATNHNMGMRLLSAAALIDNKQMILCSVVD